jgi:hypothetical protein
MEPMYYIGLDVHKRKISYCVKEGSGRAFAEGLLSVTRLDLDLPDGMRRPVSNGLRYAPNVRRALGTKGNRR